MANLVFYTDYGPLLSRVFKSAFIIYTYYDKFKNDEGIVQFTYNELNEHLGLASTTIQKANAVLRKLQLIEEVESTTGKKYKILPVKALTDELRSEILEMTSVEAYNTKSSVRTRFLQDNIPADFQQLLNKKVLKKAQKDLGPSYKKAKDLCKYFKIDYHTFKLLQEKDGPNSFKARLQALIEEIDKESMKKDKVADKEKYREDVQELTRYMYDRLAERNVKPIGNWWMKNCAIAYNLLSSGLTLEEGKAMIDWGFADNWWCDKMSDLKVLSAISTRYKLGKVKTTEAPAISRATELPREVIDEIKGLAQNIQISTYEDAYMLKESVLSGTTKKNILEIVHVLERHGVLPTGSKNLTFG